MLINKGVSKAIVTGSKSFNFIFEVIESKLSKHKEIEKIRKDLIVFAIKHV
jgi:hypothetical protein